MAVIKNKCPLAVKLNEIIEAEEKVTNCGKEVQNDFYSGKSRARLKPYLPIGAKLNEKSYAEEKVTNCGKEVQNDFYSGKSRARLKPYLAVGAKLNEKAMPYKRLLIGVKLNEVIEAE